MSGAGSQRLRESVLLFFLASEICAPLAGESSELTEKVRADKPHKPAALAQKASGAGRDKYSNTQIVHLLNRICYGPAPGDLQSVKETGVEKFIEQQLHPESIELPDDIRQRAQTPALSQTPAQLFVNFGKPALEAIKSKSGSDKPEDKKEFQRVMRETFKKLYDDTARARLERAVHSPAQLQEVMTDFWYNHFNVSVEKHLDHLWVGSYEETAIRPHALGRFRDILGATAHHAAMLFYLDNWQNTAPEAEGSGGRFNGINENYARELMELHTLGVDGGYSQKDVQEMARVLTGLGLPPGGGGKRLSELKEGKKAGQSAGSRRLRQLADGSDSMGTSSANNRLELMKSVMNNKLGYYFDPERHDFGDKTVLGHQIKGSGEAEIEEVLDILSRHPSTARHISYQLAQYFVCDNPPPSLVDKLSRKFLDSDGDIRAVLDTLLHSNEFWSKSAENCKFKSPYRYLISSLRASEARIEDPMLCLNFLTQEGQPLYKCLTPDGYKHTEDAWLNPNSLINRLNFATAYGYGRLPGVKPALSDPAAAADCIGPVLSDRSINTITSSPPNLRISLVLGSPEFMKY